MAGHLVNALSAMGMHKDTIGEVVDRLEPLSCGIADHPATAWPAVCAAFVDTEPLGSPKQRPRCWS